MNTPTPVTPAGRLCLALERCKKALEQQGLSEEARSYWGQLQRNAEQMILALSPEGQREAEAVLGRSPTAQEAILHFADCHAEEFARTR